MKIKAFVFSILLGSFITGSFAQEFNATIRDSKSDSEILYGFCNREGLTMEPFNAWYESEYESYHVDEVNLLEMNHDMLSLSNLTIVLGTWCSDSQREVPRMLKILDYLNYPEDNLELICVDRAKDAENTEVSELQIDLVPTFIFYLEGDELGRIIETPNESLEIDLTEIFSL